MNMILAYQRVTMKQRWKLFVLISIAAILLTGCTKQNDFHALGGPYLGQKPPGMTPEIFAPGITSTGHEEFKAVFSPDGKEPMFENHRFVTHNFNKGKIHETTLLLF